MIWVEALRQETRFPKPAFPANPGMPDNDPTTVFVFCVGTSTPEKADDMMPAAATVAKTRPPAKKGVLLKSRRLRYEAAARHCRTVTPSPRVVRRSVAKART
jgi:hypothetical protein